MVVVGVWVKVAVFVAVAVVVGVLVWVNAGLGVFVFGLGLVVEEGIKMIIGVLLGVTSTVPVPVTCGDPIDVTEGAGVDGVCVV